MVYPPVSAESTNRCTLEPSLSQTQPSAPTLPQQQQQQQLLYAPYNSITCGPQTNTAQCIYNARRNPSNTVPLRGQGFQYKFLRKY